MARENTKRITLDTTPFSRYGSYYAIRRVFWEDAKLPKGLYLRSVASAAAAKREMLRIELTHEMVSVPFTEHFEFSRLRLESEFGNAEICFETEEMVRIHARGVGIRLIAEDGQDGYHTAYARFQEPGRSVLYNAQNRGSPSALSRWPERSSSTPPG